MSAIEQELASQSSCWREAIARVGAARALLPKAGERVLVTGCGSSLFMAQAYAALREGAGEGETDAFPASEAPMTRSYDRVIAISRSGTTTEVVRFLGSLPAGIPTLTLSADGGSPLVASADAAVVLEFADERSVVQTRSATSALAFLRASLGEDLGPAIADAERALVDPLPLDPAAFDQFVFLGHGWTVGLANEAALKLRETAQAWTESYPAMEYRHGPISVAGPRSLVWILGSPDSKVAEDVRATGATVVQPDMDPMAALVQIQRTGVALAAAKGLDPDRPRHLTRSVVLA